MGLSKHFPLQVPQSVIAMLKSDGAGLMTRDVGYGWLAFRRMKSDHNTEYVTRSAHTAVRLACTVQHGTISVASSPDIVQRMTNRPETPVAGPGAVCSVPDPVVQQTSWHWSIPVESAPHNRLPIRDTVDTIATPWSTMRCGRNSVLPAKLPCRGRSITRTKV